MAASEYLSGRQYQHTPSWRGSRLTQAGVADATLSVDRPGRRPGYHRSIPIENVFRRRHVHVKPDMSLSRRRTGQK